MRSGRDELWAQVVVRMVVVRMVGGLMVRVRSGSDEVMLGGRIVRRGKVVTRC